MEKKKVFLGYVNLDGLRLEVEFAVNHGATKEEIDSAFLDSLSKKAEINYVCIGEQAESQLDEPFTETDAAALRASGVTDYCNQVCGGGNCGGAGLCQYGIDPNTHMPPVPLRYWAVTGRIPGDDEDQMHTFHVATRDDAVESFKEAIWATKLDAEAGKLNTHNRYGEIAYISSVVVSNTEIFEE